MNFKKDCRKKTIKKPVKTMSKNNIKNQQQKSTSQIKVKNQCQKITSKINIKNQCQKTMSKNNVINQRQKKLQNMYREKLKETKIAQVLSSL